MDLPSFQSYGNYSSENYGAHALQFFTPNGTFWFSYKTLIAFKYRGSDLVIRENEWKTTTGKHLNWIDPDKKKRVNGETFQKIFEEELKKVTA